MNSYLCLSNYFNRIEILISPPRQWCKHHGGQSTLDTLWSGREAPYFENISCATAPKHNSRKSFIFIIEKGIRRRMSNNEEPPACTNWQEARLLVGLAVGYIGNSYGLSLVM